MSPGPYPHWPRDCRRWEDVVAVVNGAATSERDDLRTAAIKVADAINVGGDRAGQMVFVGLLALDAPLAYAFDYTGFDQWVAEVKA